MPRRSWGRPGPRLPAGRLDFFLRDPGNMLLFDLFTETSQGTLRTQLDTAYWVNLPDGWHPALQARRPWHLPRTVGRVKEQGTVNLNGDRGLIEMVTSPGQILGRKKLFVALRKAINPVSKS